VRPEYPKPDTEQYYPALPFGWRRGNRIVVAFRLVGEPGEEYLFYLRIDDDEESLAVGDRVIPGIVQSWIDQENAGILDVIPPILYRSG